MNPIHKPLLSLLIKRCCLIVCFGISTMFCQGQATVSHKVRLEDDLNTLRDTLTLRYPSLYRYHTRHQIDRLFASIKSSISDSTTDLQFFRALKYIVSELKDGHLYAGPSASIVRHIKSEATFFPLRLYFAGDKAYIVNALSDKYPVGSEVISINGKSLSNIKKTLFQYIPGDGNITTKKIEILNNVFHIYYFLAFGEYSKFQVKLKAPDGTTTIEVSAVPEAQVPAALEHDDSGKALQLTVNDGVAILRIKSFDRLILSADGLDFEAFIKSAFEQIDHLQIGKLIIDLRDNGGGTDLYGALLYRYLATRPFQYYKKLSTVTDQLPYQKLLKEASSFNNLRPSLLTRVTDGFILQPAAHSNLVMQQPTRYPYTATVVFLINGLTFSTAAEFCAMAASEKRGLFVGQETGGAYIGNTSGVLSDLTLPNTGIKISFGLIEYQMAVREKLRGRGVIPNYPVIPSWKDVTMNIDVQMKVARDLLR
ncbi:S41 family peptidase [Chitinophaga rhizophila]|uniref:Tail specific protease domain-containing protein n=1 Tax=Chitinophaga rhizophila TaxID=2866212 RepID=A0ABS7G5Y4_9BACT|nr:S41 family peptidase [Chitinophaga rhizophila]MBW8683067.1 hypothetical protein [Chitinophaga rhizophila]